MKIAIVLGTRPEIIKMSPVIRALEQMKADYFILHTGQHYSYFLDKVFFKTLKLPAVKYNLKVGSGSLAEEVGRMLVGVEKILVKARPDIVLVQGDTNSVFAGALTAARLNIKVGHVEAGLRSYDRQMPEEINRVLTDHCSDYLFPPTTEAKKNLVKEGISEERIYLTGNTIVDAVYQNLKFAESAGNVLESLNLAPKKYFLVTLHRQENVDNSKRFALLLEGLDKVASEFGLPVVYPMHPRSRNMMTRFGLKTQNIQIIDPVDFLSFLQLESNARLILSDSGGVQEEACILKVPCVTLRDNTERPETVEVGANILAGVKPARILECVHLMHQRENKWENPFGDGKAGERIVQLITSRK